MGIEEELYQEIILEHYRSTVHRGVLDGYTHSEMGDNPTCGDTVTLYLKIADQTLHQLSFQGAGCAICCASADMLCEAVHGLPTAEARKLYTAVHNMLTVESGQEQVHLRTAESYCEDLGALIGVRKFPLRVKCALLAWRALENMLAPTPV